MGSQIAIGFSYLRTAKVRFCAIMVIQPLALVCGGCFYLDQFNSIEMNEQIYDYVYANCQTNKTTMAGRWRARISMFGQSFNEYGDNQIEARAKLANELSKSKYIQNNFKTTK